MHFFYIEICIINIAPLSNTTMVIFHSRFKSVVVMIDREIKREKYPMTHKLSLCHCKGNSHHRLQGRRLKVELIQPAIETEIF